jgi:YebC/PmpR family DNA-binding regulatory protein
MVAVSKITGSFEDFMAGHSKWANIQHRKGRQDAKRGKVFTKLIKEVTVAARMGGGDPNFNPRLRLAVDKAKAENMPGENIDRAIKRGTGELEGVTYEEARYEGYGIAGAAVMVDCLTDNKTRTVADVRHAFSKFGGNMGTDGCVAFQFKHCGVLMFAPGVSEDELMEAALEAGAEDIVSNEDGSIEVVTAPYEYTTVKETLDAAGFKAEFGEVTMKPQNETELSGDDAERMQKLLDALESLDDVQDVYTSALMDE